MKIQGAVALVTGANRGLGKELVRALLHAGADKVYAAARDVASLEDTLSIDPSRIVALTLDITSATEIAAAAIRAYDITLLVNNAAYLNIYASTGIDSVDLRRHFDVNVVGTEAVTYAFIDILASNGGGAIVNILSLLALDPASGFESYSASKAAMLSLTRSLSTTLANCGTEVHAVFPGPIDTRMLAELKIVKELPQHVAANIVREIMLGNLEIFPDPISRRVGLARGNTN